VFIIYNLIYFFCGSRIELHICTPELENSSQQVFHMTLSPFIVYYNKLQNYQCVISQYFLIKQKYILMFFQLYSMITSGNNCLSYVVLHHPFRHANLYRESVVSHRTRLY